MINSSILNLLSIIRIGNIYKKKFVYCDYTKITYDVLRILYKSGYIRNFIIIKNLKKKNKIKIFLKYINNNSVFNKITFFSSYSYKIFRKYKDLINLKSEGLIIINSSKGRGIYNYINCVSIQSGGQLLVEIL